MAHSKRHAWDQLDWIWHLLAYGLMTLNLVIAAMNEDRRGSIQAITLLTIILAFWYLLFIFVKPDAWEKRLPLAFLYYMVGWGIWLGLIYLNSPSMMLATFFYPQIFLRLPFRWALASAIFLTSVTFFMAFILNGQPETFPTYLLIGALFIIVQIVLGVFINALITQSSQRYKLLRELEQTRAELARAERESGTLAERQRLAREIHDTLAQDFTSIILQLTAARLSSPTTVQIHIQQAEQIAREGLDEARRIVWAMRPEQLDYASLAQNIEQLATRFSAENSIRVETILTGSPRSLGPEKESALYRITQEALTNVKKHAHASQVNITLSYMSDLVVLDIMDNGIGFQQANPYGFGLKTMRDRVEELGGTLTIESEGGTAIAISLPITLENQQDVQ